MWCSAVLLMVARGEEIRERAYYFGSKESLIWMIPQEEKNGGPDPFATDFKSGMAPGKSMLRLKEAPFESPYISKGDELWDMAAELKNISGEGILIEQAIFNQTTRRLILRGNEAAFDRFDPFALGMSHDVPQMVQLKAQVYLVPRKGFGHSGWNGANLRKSYQSLAEAELMMRPGIEAVFEGGEGALKMRVEPQVAADRKIIDMRLDLSGKVKGHSFSLKTGFTGLNGALGVIELGSIGGGESLLLSLEPEIYLVGGVKLREVILDETQPLESPLDNLATHSDEEEWSADPKTGKVFRNFHVPPMILTFLDPGEDPGEGEADPFATAAPSVSRKNAPYVKSWNSKVIAGPAARVVDMKPLLKPQGVTFTEEDFACWVENSSTVYAELDRTNMELLDAIIGVG
ncbi:hypothetical protein N9230_03745 [Akkermansiaceae bacterium]|nr:hypothetical protein [Akkermansiaceae bacterium]